MKKIVIIIFFLVISGEAFSQSLNSPESISIQMTDSPLPDNEISEVIKNIKQAKNNEDLTAKIFWEEKLHALTNPQIINSAPSNFIYKKENQEIYNGSETLNMTRINSGIIVANSISRERARGDIYAALGIYGGPVNTDTLRIYRSTNNGITFTLISSLYEGFKFTANGLDAEAVSKGDSSYAFVAMNFNIGTTIKSSVIIRVRQDGNMFNVRGLFGDIGGNRYINGRVTSDNARYTTGMYIYFSATLDSNVSGTRRLRSKMCRIELPFSNEMPLIMGYEEPGTGKYAYYVDGAAPDSAKFESDITYVNTVNDSDQVYTVTVVRGMGGAFNGGASLHFSRSNNYGATAPTLFFLNNDTYLKESPRIASTGFSNNSVALNVRRLAGNWQPYGYYAPGINGSNSEFFLLPVDNLSPDTTIGVSIAARYRSNGSYLFAYNKKFGSYGNVFTRTINNNLVMGSITQANPLIATDFYGSPDASFRNVENDSCLVIWAGISGNGSYVTGGCSGTFTSVENSNESVNDFRLSQNYPNPFNPSTKINYSLPVQSNVVIKVFDVLGKEAGVLINEMQTAGSHTIEFNAINLPSGVYYYRLESDNFTDTKKMLLVK